MAFYVVLSCDSLSVCLSVCLPVWCVHFVIWVCECVCLCVRPGKEDEVGEEGYFSMELSY